MRTNRGFKMRALAIAVPAALAATMATVATQACAADDDAAALTTPASSITVGGIYVDRNAAKYGEYNGLDKKGGYVLGGFDVQGGDPYDAPTTRRWRVTGTDLGLDNRTVTGEYGHQGSFRINVGYDEIVRNQYDSFQTILNGAGSTTLTAPGNLNAATHPAQIGGISTTSSAAANVATVTNATIANSLASFTNIQSPNLSPGTLAAPNTTAATSAASPNAGLGWLIPANMHNVDIGTQRKKSNAAVEVTLTPAWSFTGSVTSEKKDGLKLTGVPSVDTGHGLAAPEPIDYTTNLYRAALNYAQDKVTFSVGYNGSIFTNGVNTWTVDSIWANNAVQGNVNRMVGAPDNEYHQFRINGGYEFVKGTKLVIQASHARATQNEQFIASGPSWYVPATSANAKVINTNFFAKLTSRLSSTLDGFVSYRYEDRDNKTPYLQTIATGSDAVATTTTTNPCGPGALPATAAVLVGGLTCYDNAPINIRRQNITAEGNYRFARGQAVRFGYDFARVERTSDVADQDPYRAEKTDEHTLRIQYRTTMVPNLNARVGYEYSRRRHSEYELEVPLGGTLGAAVEPLLPNLINTMVAARDRNRVRGALDYQVNEALALSGSFNFNDDKYTDDDFYGRKSARSWVLNLEAAYALSDRVSTSAFYTYEDQKSTMSSLSILRATPTAINPLAANCKAYPSTASYSATGAAVSFGSPSDWYTDPCRVWGEEQADKVHTLGFALRAQASPRFMLDGSVSYSYALTPIRFTGMQVVSNGLSIGAYGTTAAVANNIFIPVANMPDATVRTWDLRLAGTYTIDKKSAVRVLYSYRKLSSSDAQWDAYANNPVAIQGYVGTNIASPRYSVNAVSVAYIYSFR